ncbi:MAG: hypothetical protein RIC30_08040 [Marinoscillum sp.]|uniref:hypothetical protein n=1 Tax=Marinoscillum sp. TaxID=2024838 RepID=UPI0032F8E699
MLKRTSILILGIWVCSQHSGQAQDLPDLLSDEAISKANYLPDFSYAGYHFGEDPIPASASGKVLHATDFGVIPNDGKDDSKALQRALSAAHEVVGPVTLQLPPGRLILSEVLYIERSHLVLRGSGSGASGTTIYCPRPMSYFPDPPALSELREYLVELDKRQREPENNIDLPFSQYAWAGGVIWTRQPGVRTKAYLDKYDVDPVVLCKVLTGERGTHQVTVSSSENLKVGQVIQIEWYNTEGQGGSLIRALYGERPLKIGSHHWNYPTHPLVQQRALITRVSGNNVTIKDPLLMDIREAWAPAMVEWAHLEEVGIEHIRIVFPMAPNIAHHIEEGYNAIYLTRLFNGWVTDVKIENADSGILTEEIANVTVSDIETSGEKIAHYSVAMSGVHNVLVQRLRVRNEVRHPLSFNTFSTRSVYTDCQVEVAPLLDQHAGANHQNLFDNIRVNVSLNGADQYPLFAGGGAGYWKPAHGAYTTFWNIGVTFGDGFDTADVVTLNGMTDGPMARLMGIYANRKIEVVYGPDAYIERVNSQISDVRSLYQYQLDSRIR